MTDPANEPDSSGKEASETSQTKAAEPIGLTRALVTTPQEAAPPIRRPSPVMIATAAVGAVALGAVALGAVAVGALAIGRLAIGSLAVGRSRMGRVEIGDLVVHRLTVLEVVER
jgi:hypothetical protein